MHFVREILPLKGRAFFGFLSSYSLLVIFSLFVYISLLEQTGSGNLVSGSDAGGINIWRYDCAFNLEEKLTSMEYL